MHCRAGFDSKFVSLLVFMCALGVTSIAQVAAGDVSAADASIDSKSGSVAPVAIDKRAYGVLPNYRTAEEANPFKPITSKQKMTIAYKDTVDTPIFAVSAAFAGLYQLENQNPSFGQGFKGYAKRYGFSYVDQAVGNFFSEGILPSMFHDDPRYYRRGTGTASSRTTYALTRILLTKSDKGNWRFNSSEFLGNGIAVAVSNAYYPDTRTVSDNANKFVIQLGTDALSNVLKEFWPDVKKKLMKNKN